MRSNVQFQALFLMWVLILIGLAGIASAQCVGGQCVTQFQQPTYGQPVQAYPSSPAVVQYGVSSNPQINLEPGGYYSITPGNVQPTRYVQRQPRVIQRIGPTVQRTGPTVVRQSWSNQRTRQQQWQPGTVLRRWFW